MPYTHTKTGYAIIDGDIVWMYKAGVPGAGDGVDVAGKGSLCSDITNGNLYINAGTKAVPAWKLVTRAA